MKKISDFIKVDQLSKNSFFELGIKDKFKELINGEYKINLNTSDIKIKDKVILIKGNSKLKTRILLNKNNILIKLNGLIRDIK